MATTEEANLIDEEQISKTSQEISNNTSINLKSQELNSTAVDTAAAEAAEAAKVAAAAAAEAARVAEQLAAEAAKVAEAAAAEKSRLEEEAAAAKIKEFVDSQSDLYKEIYSKNTKINTHICLKLEELVKKNFLSIEDLNNPKFNEALKDLNENCINAFDDYIFNKESKSTDDDTMKASSEILDSQNEKTEEKVKNETPNSIEESTEKTLETAKIKSNVDTLCTSLFKWKRSNKDKLSTSCNKIQSLLQGQPKNNRRSMERPGPNVEKLKEILERTGYSHEISSGQRKYGGPPPGWIEANAENISVKNEKPDLTTETSTSEAQILEGSENNQETNEFEKEIPTTKKETNSSVATAIPPQGCECFVGKLPRDLFEDELIPVFEKYGRIWDLRLMIDPSSGFSKGYCFVTYCEKNDAQTAAKALNDFEIRPGKEIRVNLSVANIKLFIGNIPKTKTKEELKSEFTKIVEGLSEVIIYHQGEAENDKLKNRGFCFLEFIDHKSASVAKRKLSSSRFNRVFNREIAVDWADPNDEPDEETMAKVKVLYVKNLSAEVTEEEVQSVFEAYGKLERVRKMKDYAFVHFDLREDAVKAMEEQNTKVLGKLPLEISLARPLTEKKKQAQQKRLEGGRNNHMNNGNNWNNGNNNFNQRQNNRNFNHNGGNRGGQINNFNGNRNTNGNRSGNFGMNNGMNRNGGNRGGFNNRGGNMNSGSNVNSSHNFNNQRNNGMNNGRGGNGSFRSNNVNRGGFNGNSYNNNQMMHKRKNNDNNFSNGDNGQKKGRFGNNNNGNFNNSSQLIGQNFSGNGWNNFNGMQQGNDASNEFYQDNFNSNQWL